MRPWLVRALIVGLAYVAASAAAALVVLVLVGSSAHSVVSFLPAAITVVLIFALIPFGIALAILRGLGRTDWLSHAVAGALVAFAAQVVMAPPMLVHPLELLASWQLPAGGALGGAVYWLAYTGLSRRFLPAA